MKNIWFAFFCVALVGSGAQALAQQTFSTPDDAVSALVDAAKASDPNKAAAILGPGGADIAKSGDEVSDRYYREKFVAGYEAKHELELEGNGTQTLIIGENDWAFPVPLVNKDGQWQFDAQAGLDEILRRRIGKNELFAIQVSLAYVQAQNEYAALDPMKDGGPYAQHIVSRKGRKDGLYWPTTAGEEPSPLGDLVAKATTEGYKAGEKPIPYHGYYYRILTKQGASADGGAYDYLVKGKMIGGFALVAYPAKYGNSGIMTFMVNHDGTVFEKDLGPNTESVARKINSFAPDNKWVKVGPSESAAPNN
jgi:hypothetical protein